MNSLSPDETQSKLQPIRFLNASSLASGAREIDAGKAKYNYGTTPPYGDELPGISVFYRDEADNIFHTYSTYARGLDMMNAAYHYLDLTPLGRHEEGLPYPMDWVRLRDQYQPEAAKAACCHS